MCQLLHILSSTFTPLTTLEVRGPVLPGVCLLAEPKRELILLW